MEKKTQKLETVLETVLVGKKNGIKNIKSIVDQRQIIELLLRFTKTSALKALVTLKGC